MSCQFTNDHDAESRFLDIDSTEAEVAQAEEDIKESYADHYAHCLNVTVCCKAFAYFALRELFRDLAFFTEASFKKYRKIARSQKTLLMMSGYAGEKEASLPIGHLARSVLPHLDSGPASRKLLEEGARFWPKMETLYMDTITDEHFRYHTERAYLLQVAFQELVQHRPLPEPGFPGWEPLALDYPHLRAIRRYRTEVEMPLDVPYTEAVPLSLWDRLEVFTGSGDGWPDMKLKEMHLYCVGHLWMHRLGQQRFEGLERLTVQGLGEWRSDHPDSCHARLADAQRLVDSLGDRLRYLRIRLTLLDDNIAPTVGQPSQYASIAGPSLLKRFPLAETLDVSRCFLSREFFEELAVLDDTSPLQRLVIAEQLSPLNWAGGDAHYLEARKVLKSYPVKGFQTINWRLRTLLDIESLSNLKRAANLILNHEIPMRQSSAAFVDAQKAAGED